MNLKARQFSFTKANWRLYKAIYKTCTKYEIYFLHDKMSNTLTEATKQLLLNGGKTRRMNFIIQCHPACMTRQKIFFCTVFRHSMNTVDVFLLAYVHFSFSLYSFCVQKYCAWFLFFSHLPILSALEKTDFAFWSFMSKDIIDCSFCARICTEWVKAIASEKKWNHGMKHAFKS